MKKAMMYLLLALGITLFVMFVGGAVCGFIIGFIDGINGKETGTASSMSYLVGFGSALVLVLCAILNFVFLRNKFASYTIGRIPKPICWKVFLGMILAMSGMAVLYAAMNDIAIQRGWEDETMRELYAQLGQNPLYTLLLIVVIEATSNLIIYGAVMREILEWKHHPMIIGHIYAVVMALITLAYGNVLLILPAMMLARFEIMVYEYTRSVIPIIIGDVAFWIVTLCLLGVTSHGWWILIASILALPGVLLALNPMEPYKPID
jgi:hypothetical protein